MADFALGRAVYSLEVDDGKYNQQIDQAEGKSRGMFDRLKGLGSGLAVFGLAVGGVRELGSALTGLVSDAMAAQQVSAQTQAVLASTGGAAGVSAKQIGELAGALSRVTPFEDEAVQGGENLLLTFTNIGSDVFPDATKAMLDMSQAMGTDIKGSAVQLGKALNDPVKGVTALTRVGVTFTESQKAAIQAMVDTGDVAGAQKLILAELGKEFGGSAEAAGKTFPGQLKILQTQFGNLKEIIGGVILQALVPLVGALTAAANWAGDVLPGALGRLLGIVRGPLTAAWTLARDAVLTFIAALKGDWSNSDQIVGLHRVLGNLGLLIHAVIVPAWHILSAALDLAREHFDTIKRVLGDLISIQGGPALAIIKGMIRGFGKDGLAGILPGAVDGLKRFGSALLDLGKLGLQGLGKLLDVLKGVDWGKVAGAVWTALRTALSTVGGLALDLGSKFLDLITGVEWGKIAGKAWALLGTALGTAVSLAIDLGSQFLDLVTGVDWGTVATSVWTFLGTALSTAWDGVLDAGAWFASIVTGIDYAGLAGTIWGFLGTALGTAWDGVVDAGAWFIALVTGIDYVGIATTVWTFLGTALSTAWNGIVDAGAWFAGLFAAVDWAGAATAVWSYLGPALSTAWAGIVDAALWFQNIATGTDWTGVAATIWTSLSGALATASATASSGGSLLAGLLDATGIDFTPLTAKLAELQTALQPIIDLVSTSFVNAWNSLKTAFDQIVTSITTATPLWQQLGALWASLQPVLAALQPILQGLGILIGAVLVAAVVALAKGVELLAPIFGQSLVASVNIAIGILTSLIAAITLVVNSVVDTVRIINDLLHGDWSAAWTDAKQMVQDMVDGVIGIWSGLPALIAGYAADLVGQVLGWFQNLWSEAVGKVSGMVGEIETSVGGLVSSVGGFFNDLYTTATGKVQDLWNDVVTFFGNIYTSATTKAGETKDEVVRIVGALPGEALSALGDLTGYLAGAGADLIRGLISGITSMAKEAADAALNVVKGAVDAAKGFLGISSPSQLMHDEVGIPLVEGITAGLLDARSMIPPAMGSLADSILAAANAQINSLHAPFQESAADLAKALVDGIIAGAPSAGDAVSYVSDSVAQSLAQMQSDLAGKIDLAKIAGADPDSIAKMQTQLDAVSGLLTGWASDLGLTVTEALDSVNVTELVSQQWSDLLGNLDDILSGQAQQQLQDTLTGLQQQLTFALAASAPQAVIDSLNATIAATQDQLAQVGEAYSTAVAAGLVSPEAQAELNKATAKLAQIPIDQLKALLPKMDDFGVGLINQLVSGVATGSASLDDALATLNAMVESSMGDLDETNDLAVTDIIERLHDLEEQLTGDLAQALIDGTDPSGIQANLSVIDDLLTQLGPVLDDTNGYLKAMGGYLDDVSEKMGNVASGAKDLKDALGNITGGDGPWDPNNPTQPFGTVAPGKTGQYSMTDKTPELVTSDVAVTTPAVPPGAPDPHAGPTQINLYLSEEQAEPLASWIIDAIHGRLSLRNAPIGGSLIS